MYATFSVALKEAGASDTELQQFSNADTFMNDRVNLLPSAIRNKL